MAKRMTEEEKRQRRAMLHGCDGVCYSGTSMCPAVDTCQETRKKEAWATLAAAATIVALPLLAAGALIWFLCA